MGGSCAPRRIRSVGFRWGASWGWVRRWSRSPSRTRVCKGAGVLGVGSVSGQGGGAPEGADGHCGVQGGLVAEGVWS